jgi:translation initiation factor IF-3
MVHQEIGRRLLDKVADAAKEVAVVERPPIMEGRNLFMILSPTAKPAAAPAPKESEAPKETEEVRA